MIGAIPLEGSAEQVRGGATRRGHRADGTVSPVRRSLAGASRVLTVAFITGLAAAGCSSSGPSPGPASTVLTTSPPLTAPTLTTRLGTVAGTVTLTVTDLRLSNSEAVDNGFRVFLDAAGATPEVSVVLTGVPAPNRVINVCPAIDLQQRIPAPGCVTPASGERVVVQNAPNYRGLEIAQVGVAGQGGSGNAWSVDQIAITFPAGSREVRFRLPAFAAGDAGGRPTFRLSPVGPGSYRASATWSGAGELELVLVAGTTTVSRAQGGPGSVLTGNQTPPAEADLRVRNTGTTTLGGVLVTVLFP